MSRSPREQALGAFLAEMEQQALSARLRPRGAMPDLDREDAAIEPLALMALDDDGAQPAARSVAEIFGDVVRVMMQSPAFRDLTLVELQRLVLAGRLFKARLTETVVSADDVDRLVAQLRDYVLAAAGEPRKSAA